MGVTDQRRFDLEAEIPTNSHSLKLNDSGPACNEGKSVMAAVTTINSKPHVQVTSEAQQAMKPNVKPNIGSPPCEKINGPGENDLSQGIAFGPTCHGAHLVKEIDHVCCAHEGEREAAGLHDGACNSAHLSPIAMVGPNAWMLDYMMETWCGEVVMKPQAQFYKTNPDYLMRANLMSANPSLISRRA
ncbi:serine/threonine-protein phosphatase PP1-beta-like [Sesbania bispinosa]|nr:serine/threonine-protein phosphatase PP1-beta-like [Sesbania bispinosa]